MEEQKITNDRIRWFGERLSEEERSSGTIEKYQRELRQLGCWLKERPMTKELLSEWKKSLIENGYCPATINGKLAAINRYLELRGWSEMRLKALKVQRKVFCDTNRELTKTEYERLIRETQKQGKKRLELLMETICSTGIRVSEVQYITVEALERGKAEIHLKGKIRVILLTGKLCKKMLKYAKKQKISAGPVFVTRKGVPISRKQIWADMKKLCVDAGVESTKVFPHNLRHLFARFFYNVCKDIVKLADVLGHSNVETTRIYLLSSGREHARTLEQLRLIL